MTNTEIILSNSIELMKKGILKGTGIIHQMTIVDEEGNEKTISYEVPEVIHTFQTWKSLGYHVKKGEHSSIQFPIWKYISARKSSDETDIKSNDRCYMKPASWFTFAQVEKD